MRRIAIAMVVVASGCFPIKVQLADPAQPWPQQPSPPALSSGYPYWIETLITGVGAVATAVLVNWHRVRWHTKHGNGNGSKLTGR